VKNLLMCSVFAALAACGGSSQPADTAPAGDDEIPATPVATEGGGGDEAEPAAAPADNDVTPCAAVCGAVIGCTILTSGKVVSDDELAAARDACIAQCGEEDPVNVDKTYTCVKDNPNDCGPLFQCIEQIQPHE
jgi:Cys-rich protein (TIGR04453 family)